MPIISPSQVLKPADRPDPRAYLLECQELLEHSLTSHPSGRTAILRIIDVLDLQIQRIDSLEARLKYLETKEQRTKP